MRLFKGDREIHLLYLGRTCPTPGGCAAPRGHPATRDLQAAYQAIRDRRLNASVTNPEATWRSTRARLRRP